jgi:hypothetical protein
MSDPDREDKPCADSLRLTVEQQAAILNELDRRARISADRESRREERIFYRDAKGVLLAIAESDGTESPYLIRPRNICRTGLGFLHGGPLPPGTTCILTLPTADGDKLVVRARVAHCGPVSGEVHQVGLQFDEPIDVPRVVPTLVGSGGIPST